MDACKSLPGRAGSGAGSGGVELAGHGKGCVFFFVRGNLMKHGALNLTWPTDVETFLFCE